MLTCDTKHIHIVFNANDFGHDHPRLLKLVETARQLVTTNRVHLITSGEKRSQISQTTQLPGDNLIIEPAKVGGSAAIAYAGYELFRLDPNAIMVFVGSEATHDQLDSNFERLATEAANPGAIVSLKADGTACIFAWSIYALMETFRNHSPVDYQIINEMVRVGSRDPDRTEQLYLKLKRDSIETTLLNRMSLGYPTQHICLSPPAECV